MDTFEKKQTVNIKKIQRNSARTFTKVRMCFHDRILGAFHSWRCIVVHGTHWTFAMVTLERVSGLSWQTRGQVAPCICRPSSAVNLVTSCKSISSGIELSSDRPRTDFFGRLEFGGPCSRRLKHWLDESVSTELNGSVDRFGFRSAKFNLLTILHTMVHKCYLTGNKICSYFLIDKRDKRHEIGEMKLFTYR